MPTYQFFCEKCGYEDEIFMKMSKRNVLRACPNCSYLLTRKIGKGNNIIFRGKGFYCNDYPKK